VGKLAQDFSLNTNYAIADRQDATCEIELSDRIPDLEWDNFLAHTRGGSHFQTSRWAEVKLEPGWHVLRVKVRGGAEVLGGAQILIRRVPLLGSIGFISRGPVVSSAHREILTPLIGALRKVAQQHQIQYLLLQPPCGDGWMVDHVKEKGFLRSIVSVAPDAIVLIDLSLAEDVLLNRITPRVRRYIRSAISKGISVREAKEEDFPIFLHLLHVTAAAKEWSIFSDSYYCKTWKALYPTKNLRLTIARREQEDIAALLVYAHGEMVYGKTLVRTGQHKNSGVHELLLWESIKWARSSGYCIYDLSRIDPALGEKYFTGSLTLKQVMGDPSFSKLKFGGEVVLCPKAYTYLYNPWLRWVYRLTFQATQKVPFVQQFAERTRGLRRRIKSKRDLD
jgi:lipid II:glycine glycyltransferase (peptidoglycan interpeptide bridge formation enzyme)